MSKISEATCYINTSKVSFVAVLVVLAVANPCIYLTEGVTMCGDVLVHLHEANSSSRNFPEASCCMFNPFMCTWKSVADPTANVSQRAEPTGKVLNDIVFHGEYHCTNITDGMIKEKVLYLSEGIVASMLAS